MADDVAVQFGAQIAGLTNGLAQAGTQVSQFTDRVKSSIGGLQTPFEQLNKAILGVAAVAAGGLVFKSFVDSATTAASEVLKLQKALGINSEAAQQLRVQLQGTGNTVDDYVSSSLRLDRQVRQNEETIRKTGMATRDANGEFLNGDRLMMNAIATLKNYKEGTDRNIASQVIFGRGAGDIAGFMKLNAASFEQAAKDLKELGLEVTPQAAANAKAYKASMHELELSFMGIKEAIGNAVLPYLTAFATWFRGQAPGLISGMKETTKTIIEWAFDVAAGFVKFAGTVGEAIFNVFTIYQYVQTKLGNQTEAGAHAALDALQSKLDAFGKMRKTALEAIASLKETTLAGGPNAPIPDASPAGTKSAGGLTAGANKAGEIAKIRLEAERQVSAIQLEQQKENLNAQVSQYQITENQKNAILLRSTEEQYQTSLLLLNKEAAALAGDAVKREQVLAKIKVARAKHELDIQKINNDSIAKQQAKYEQLFSTIQGAWDSQLKGLLSGTTTWAQAWKNILADLTLQFISFAEKTALNWAAAELAKTTATTTGVATRTAAETAGAATGIFTTIANALKSILSSVGITIAGVTANQAPIVGPLAPAEGIAAGAATMAAATAVLPSFDVGAWRIPRDTTATVHRGETIIPAGPAAAFRKMLESGNDAGGDVHLHINTIDQRGMRSWLMENKDGVAAAGRAAARNLNR